MFPSRVLLGVGGSPPPPRPQHPKACLEPPWWTGRKLTFFALWANPELRGGSGNDSQVRSLQACPAVGS